MLPSGRYVEIKILPLSFKEFLSAHPADSNIDRLYQDYIHNSSFPYALELLRRGYEVYIGKVGSAEVDFIAMGEEGEEYYQVAYTVIDGDGKTLERELAPLNAIRDHNPKYLLTMDYGPVVSHNGIKQVNVLDWLIK